MMKPSLLQRALVSSTADSQILQHMQSGKQAGRRKLKRSSSESTCSMSIVSIPRARQRICLHVPLQLLAQLKLRLLRMTSLLTIPVIKQAVSPKRRMCRAIPSHRLRLERWLVSLWPLILSPAHLLPTPLLKSSPNQSRQDKVLRIPQQILLAHHPPLPMPFQHNSKSDLRTQTNLHLPAPQSATDQS